MIKNVMISPNRQKERKYIIMTSKELVIKTMKGENPGRTPIYGWVAAELSEPITKTYGSVAAFEDKYRFDMAHIFGGPRPFSPKIDELRKTGVEITPEVLLDFPFNEIDQTADYEDVKASLAHHRQRDRFCYVQTYGIFEALNDAFGIENHLMYMALYPDELKEVYKRMADWNIKNAEHMIELGVDDIHVSDDWGSQKALMFSPAMYEEMILPEHMRMVSAYKKGGVMASLHSDGCIVSVLDHVVEIGYDFIHPWQEVCNMPYSIYLEKYQDKFGILGGVCVQSTLGFGNFERLESEIRRVFSLLKGKRWACCTTHFVESTCSMEELAFAYNLIRKLADQEK